MGNSRRIARAYENNLMIVYDRAEQKFKYPVNAGEFFSGKV